MDNKIKLPLLETERLFLVPWSYEYAEDMLSFASSPNIAPADWPIIHTIIKTKKAERIVIRN